jgi:chromosome segregation ATPase
VIARVADDDDSGASVERTLPARRGSATSRSEMAWWQWVDARMDARLAEYSRELEKAMGQVIYETRAPLEEENRALRRELEQQRRELTVWLREQVLECGRALREEAKAAREQDEHERDLLVRELSALREQVGAEREFKAREIEQLRCAVDLHAEYQLGVKELRDQVARAKDAQAQAGEELLRRELAVLQKEIGLERAVRALHDEVEVAKSEIPQVPAIEARIDGRLSEMAAEQKRLQDELQKTKNRVSKMRVNQSITEYSLKESLKELQHAQQPAVELKFVTEDGCCFSLKDANPGAVETWRRFAADLVAANNGTMFPNDPTGRVIALPSRGAS